MADILTGIKGNPRYGFKHFHEPFEESSQSIPRIDPVMTVGDRPRCFPYGCCHSFPLPVPKPDCTPASGPVRFRAVQSARVNVIRRTGGTVPVPT